VTAASDDRRPLRALVVDDEPDLVRVVRAYLEQDGFAVAEAGDGLSAVDEARRHDPDVIVLDLMMPGLDGLEACRRIRAFSTAYVIMLTAKSDEVDKIVGLSVGADDYLTKPFSPRELLARIRAMLRRPRAGTVGPASADRWFGGLQVDPLAREVRLHGRQVPLTRAEFDILATLAAEPRMVFTRRQLLEALWGQDWFGDEHVVDVHIGRIRRKLGDDPAEPSFILTVRGVGYRMGAGGDRAS